MSLERHEAHARPRLFVMNADPVFVAVCPPHDQMGPWSEPTPYVRPREAEVAAAFSQPPQDCGGSEAHDDGLNFSDWQAETRSELAVAALERLEARVPKLQFDVEVDAESEKRRPVFAEYEGASELWYVVDDNVRAVVAARDRAVVRYFTGLSVTRALCPFVTVAVRAEQFAAALYFDWDEDRFYVAEPSGVLLGLAVDAARAAGFDVEHLDEEAYCMSGVHESVAALKTWARSAGGPRRCPFVGAGG